MTRKTDFCHTRLRQIITCMIIVVPKLPLSILQTEYETPVISIDPNNPSCSITTGVRYMILLFSRSRSRRSKKVEELGITLMIGYSL
jgi:hypothetical protein